MSVDELNVFFESQGFALGYIRTIGESATEFTYGELTIEGVRQLTVDAAARFERLNGRPPHCFVDLGSGSGKVALCAAALLHSLERSVGVELSLARHEIAKQVCEDLGSKQPGLEIPERVLLIHEDVRRAVASIAAADVIWVSNTCFPTELNEAIGAVLDEYAQEGAIVYSTRDLLFSRRAGGVHDGILMADATEMACSWAKNHRAGTCVMVGAPLALMGGNAQPDERAFLRWADVAADQEDDELLSVGALAPAVADALLGTPHCPPGDVLTELFAEDGLLAEIIETAAEEHAGGLDFEAWEEVLRECRAAVRNGSGLGSGGAFAWLCGF